MPFDNIMALAALASVIPLIIIYLLRPKPVQLSIPSLMFLMQVEKQKKRFSSIRKLLKDPLFLIQLLVLILLSTAAAAPFYTSQEDLSDEHTVIVIDASASMQAGNRLDDATRLAAGYLSKKNSVILAKSSPEIIVENTGSSQASDALASIEPSDTIADLSGAMSEGMRLLSQRGGKIVVVSDFASWEGEDPVSTKQLAQSYGIDTAFVDVGSAVGNVGIIDGWIDIEDGNYVYTCVVKNYNDFTERVDIEIENPAGSVKRSLNVGPSDTAQFRVNPLSTGVTSISIADEDNLPADNNAYVMVPTQSDTKTLFVSDEEKLPSKIALSTLASVNISTSEGIPSSTDDYKIMVIGLKNRSLTSNEVERLDSFLNNGGRVVVVASQMLESGNATDQFQNMLPVIPDNVAESQGVLGIDLEVVQSSSLTDDVKFNEIAIHKYLNATPRNDANVLVATEQGDPLLAHWSVGDGTLVYFGFNDELGKPWNNFHNLPEYPVLWAKLTAWLGGSGDISDYNLETGDVTSLAREMTVQTPTSTMTTQKVVFEEVGTYKIGGRTVAVNLYSDRESDTTRQGSEVMERVSDKKRDSPDIVRQDSYEAKNYLDNYLIILAILLAILEILIIRNRGEL
ncbi:vWA domain-containing protein [Methanohalophilus mahii]|uniref:Uncharacterized protein n=1 Tax=Methanohalophilus mahii (strain ATCC 35705 / DSM 5219 / SLP) TaxID=547558 RepID=D5EBD3_METMS|nr:BatA and WFA domain-containing protein [Methanohalophilus mahii]ADE36484.1 conserved hypothetical protein [Methanohalophilus mahii DSM 5219]